MDSMFMKGTTDAINKNVPRQPLYSQQLHQTNPRKAGLLKFGDTQHKQI